MKKTYAKLFLLTLVFFLTFFCIQKVLAGDFGGLETTAGAANLKSVASVQTLVGNIIGAVLSLISVVFFALMLFAGIRWMTARGNEEAEKKARDTIFAGAIGMVIIMASYGLTNLVFNAATRGGTMAGTEDGSAGTKKPGGQSIVAGEWCLNLESGECLKGAGSPCPGKLFKTQDECIADPAASVVCLDIDNKCIENVTNLDCLESQGVVFADMAKCAKVADSSVELSPEGSCIMNTAIATICTKLGKDGCNLMADLGYGCKMSGTKCVVNSNICTVELKSKYSECILNPGCEWLGKTKSSQKNNCVINKAVELGCGVLSKNNCTGFCAFENNKCIVASGSACATLKDAACLDKVPYCMIQ